MTYNSYLLLAIIVSSKILLKDECDATCCALECRVFVNPLVLAEIGSRIETLVLTLDVIAEEPATLAKKARLSHKVLICRAR